jgi:beta-glucosidase-like glycosyl hydrolase
MKSLTQLVAQMVMPRINGMQLEDPVYRQEIEALVREGMGGFILFGGTVERTPARLAALQALATTPLLISSDVERGLGQQLQGGTRFPSQRAVAAAISRSSKSDAGLLQGMLDAVRTETRAAGIQIVFSPVMDVNNNSDNPIICTRAFGDKPEVVEWFGSRYITGLQRSNHNGKLDLLACAKHFPGHGDTDQDSHSVLPVIKADRARLNSVELPPFREAVKDGVGTIMVAHLLVPALDAEKPTTFSKKTITALLREGMAFDGLIVSDALDMGALAGAYSQEEIAVRAVAAGMDILLHPLDARVTINAVAAAVEQGRLTRTRIEESVSRIRDAKSRLGLFDPGAAKAPEIDYEKHRSLARELSRKALQIVSENKKVLPLGKGSAACFMLDDDAEGRGDSFLRTLQTKVGTFIGTVLTPDTELQQSHLSEQIAAVDWVVLPIFSKISASKGRSGISPKLRAMASQIIAAAQAAKKRSVVISFDSPYILEQFKDADLCIAAYDRMDEIQQAAAEMLVTGSRVQ